MVSLIKTYWLPVVVLFVVFFDELFNCIAIVRGFTVDTGMKKYEAMLLATIGYSMIGYDMLKGKIKKKEHRALVVLFAILFLYMLTSVFYGGTDAKYLSYLLVFGSECIPAAYIGIRLAKSGSLQRLDYILPFTVIPITIMIGSIGLTAAMMNAMVTENSGIGVEAGLNYQSLSYFMAFGYTYAFYYVFYGKIKSGLKNIFLKMAMAVDMLFCAAVCLMGGGRGAFVYIVAITFFLLVYYLKSSKKHRVHAIFIISLLIIVSMYVVISLGIMESSGMQRVTGRLTEDNERFELYQKAIDAFLTSPLIGMGIGSIWWTVGFYCHNMILDLLAETGLIGAIFLLSIVWRTLLKLYKYSLSNKMCLFLFLVMTGSLVECMFSGYYLAAFKIYFVCAFVYCLPKPLQSKQVLNKLYYENLTTR